MSRIIKVCEACKPRIPELTKFYGPGPCEACDAPAAILTGFWLYEVLRTLAAVDDARTATRAGSVARFEEEKPPTPQESRYLPEPDE